jgi:hypothetical protein
MIARLRRTIAACTTLLPMLLVLYSRGALSPREGRSGDRQPRCRHSRELRHVDGNVSRRGEGDRRRRGRALSGHSLERPGAASQKKDLRFSPYARDAHDYHTACVWKRGKYSP